MKRDINVVGMSDYLYFFSEIEKERRKSMTYECCNCGKVFKTFAAAKEHKKKSYPKAWEK
jgi:uncharacterized Zn finger protein